MTDHQPRRDAAPETKSEPEPERSAPGPRMGGRRALLLAGAGVATALGGAAAYAYLRGGASKANPGAIRDHRVWVPATTPRIVIARGPSPANNVRAALGRIGGMRQLVSRGDVVVLKPNIGWDRIPEQAANTDPEVVAALVSACLDAGAAQVIVTDAPVHDAARSFARSGIAKAAEQAGATVILPGEAEKRSVEIPGKPGRWSALEPLVRATKVINVPVAKHHGFTRFSAGMKNWFGAIAEGREMLHLGMDESVTGLLALFRPTLTVVDATRVLVRNGPTGGNLDDVKRIDAVAVSLDPVAADAWAASQVGVDPSGVDALALAQRKGLGLVDFRSLSPVEIEV